MTGDNKINKYESKKILVILITSSIVILLILLILWFIEKGFLGRYLTNFKKVMNKIFINQ